MSLVELNEISLLQGGFELQIQQLALSPGRLYVLRGENGSGKSTLLRLLALLQRPQTGTVRFAGQPVIWKAGSLKMHRQRITLLDQNPWLFSGSVENNIAFGLKLRGIRGAKLLEEIGRALDAVGLSGFQKRKTQELSGGEVRRVALARALSLKPQLLLLDEPTANLDTIHVDLLENILCTLPKQGMSVVVASHDSGQSERLSGLSINMKNGRLITTPELLISELRLKAI